MKTNQSLALLLVCVLFINVIISPALAQSQGEPIEITFGQPNIWSLEQAHYLLAQMRERSLRIKPDELKNLDPNTAEASRINLIRQLFGLTGEFSQRPSVEGLTPMTSPTPIPSPVPFPSPISEPSPLSGTILSTLLSKEFLQKLNSDSKLNATTRLDNHIQLQYEIISKQLTLLRDEVGPDERLVFLELPQSIYASGSETKGKVAQTYWEIAGFSEYNKEADLTRNVEEMKKYYEVLKTAHDNATKKYEEAKVKYQVYFSLLGEVEKAKNVFKTAEKECSENKDCSQKKDLDEKQKKLNEYRADRNNKKDVEEFDKTKADYEEKEQMFDIVGDELANLEKQSANIKYDEAAKKARETIDRIKQKGSIPNEEIVQRVMKDGYLSSSDYENSPGSIKEMKDNKNRKTRVIDIIPRQSSLNVNDIQETVKSSIFGGALSFLFGFGLRTNFQRQRDTFEQYLHQENYASGFGKGESIFGWTFGPVPGTKRIASGVRTTYAVVIVPRKAQALVMNARGCYFKSKNFQPQPFKNYNDIEFDESRWKDDDDRNCYNPKQYILPIPNAGDAGGFWITGVDYTPVAKGQKAVVSIKGRNFTTQVGVLVNGIPLQQVVELTRKLPSDDLKIGDYCESDICGKYEVVDAEEVTMVFKMPKDFEETPEITVIGPGRSVNLRDISFKITAHGTKFNENQDSCLRCKLNDKNVPFMFGSRATTPALKLSITDLQVFPGNGTITALLSGTKFTDKEIIYVNGDSQASKEFISSKQYKLTFNPGGMDTITVLVKQCLKKVTENGQEKLEVAKCEENHPKDLITTEVKTFPVNNKPFTITNATALRFDEFINEMFVRIEGTGLDNVTLSKINDSILVESPPRSMVIPVSSRELLVKITEPSATVKITLRNPSGVEISTVVNRPPDIDKSEP